MTTSMPADRLLPRYADGKEAGWEYDWGSIFIAPNDDDVLTVTVDLDFAYRDSGLSSAMAHQLAAAVQAACNAVDGKPLRWTQYRATATPAGPTDPEMPGRWKIGPGRWVGVTRLTETFDIATVAAFLERPIADGQIVTLDSRTFHTFTDISPWKSTPLSPEVVCSDGISS